MLLLLLFFTSILLTSAYNPDVYFKYPDHMIPDRHYLSSSKGDFLLMYASVVLEPDVQRLPKELILQKYRFSESNVGFVFDSDDRVKYVLVRDSARKTYHFGPLKHETGMYFYERIPDNYEQNTIYIERFYGYDHMNEKHKQRGKDTQYYCFLTQRQMFNQTCQWSPCQLHPSCPSNFSYTGESRYSNIVSDDSYCDYFEHSQFECCSDPKPSETLKEMCSRIPKCLGYIENTCLVSHHALTEPLYYSPSFSYQYYEKVRQHKIINSIQNNYTITNNSKIT